MLEREGLLSFSGGTTDEDVDWRQKAVEEFSGWIGNGRLTSAHRYSTTLNLTRLQKVIEQERYEYPFDRYVSD